MSDVPAWAAVGVSCAALGYAAFVDYQRRRDAKRQERAVVNSAISLLVAQWATTRLRTVTVWEDPHLDELKLSAKTWRENCSSALAVVPQNSRTHDIIEDTVNAASEFEAIIDPLRPSGVLEDEDKPAVQKGLTRLQESISNAIGKLNALSAGSDWSSTS